MRLNLTKSIQNFLKVFIFVFTVTSLFGQNNSSNATWISTGNGLYNFNSNQAKENLSFYLFSDGYYSFEHKPSHQYGKGAIPIHLSAKPYEQEDIQEFTMPEITDFISNPDPLHVETENMIQLTRSWNLVYDKENYFILMFENTIDDDPISGVIEFHFVDNELIINSDDILDDYDTGWVTDRDLVDSDIPTEYEKMYTWSFDNLEPGEQRFIYIKGNCNAQVFKKVKTRAVIKLDGEDGDGSTHGIDGNDPDVNDSYFYTLNSTVSSNPHDPNCIIAKQMNQACGNYIVLSYKVYFQNDGTGPAADVFVNMNIDFPYQNIRLIGASDACVLTWDFNNMNGNGGFNIMAVFPEIFLPGMNQEFNPPTNYWETVGWFEIEVCTSRELFEDFQCIFSEARIVFDDEDPVDVENEFCGDFDCNSDEIGDSDYTIYACTISEFIQSYPLFYDNSETSLRSESDNTLALGITPNPSNGSIQLTNIETDVDLEVIIYNNSNVVKRLKFNKGQCPDLIDVSGLSSGLYYISVSSQNTHKISKFVKI